MQKQIRVLLFLLTILATFSFSVFSQTGGGIAVRVRFPRGANSAAYSGSVSHSTDAYLLSARRGQTLTIKISGSGEPAFHVAKVPKGSKNATKFQLINDKDLTSLIYKIDIDDDIAILVGAIRGSSSYKLSITIK